jgi:hypothetical protein
MAITKLDMKKEYKSYYKAPKEPELVEFKAAQYIAIEGMGAPGDTEFNAKVGALYPLAFGIKNITKKIGADFAVPSLEGLWWVEEDKPFIEVPRDRWYWKLLIRLPEFVTFEMYENAKTETFKKKKIELINDIGFEKMTEGSCIQILHIGPYATEEETILKMYDYIAKHDMIPNGLHHEVYLSDPRKTEPQKMKTILRQPVTKK